MEKEQNEDKSTKKFKEYARFVISGTKSDDTAEAITHRINTLKGILFKGRNIEDISVNEVKEIQQDVYENRKKILQAYADFQKDRNTSNFKKTINGLNQRFQERFPSFPPSPSDTEDNKPSKFREHVRSVTSLVSSKGRRAISNVNAAISNSKKMFRTAMNKGASLTTSLRAIIASATPPGNNEETNIANYTKAQARIDNDDYDNIAWFKWESAHSRTPKQHKRMKYNEALRRMRAIILLVIKYKGKPGYDIIRDKGRQRVLKMFSNGFGTEAELERVEETYDKDTKLPTTEGASVSSSSVESSPPPSSVEAAAEASSAPAPSSSSTSTVPIHHQKSPLNAYVDNDNDDDDDADDDDDDADDDDNDPLGAHRLSPTSKNTGVGFNNGVIKDPLGAHRFSQKFKNRRDGFNNPVGYNRGGKRRRHTIKKNRRSIRRTTIRRR